jgi:hypothetical protein
MALAREYPPRPPKTTRKIKVSRRKDPIPPGPSFEHNEAVCPFPYHGPTAHHPIRTLSAGQAAWYENKEWQVGQIKRRLTEDEKTMRNVPRMARRLLKIWFGWELVPYHELMLWAAFLGGYWDIMVATEHGKTSLLSLAFPILSLANDPEQAHILLGADEADPMSWLALIQQQLESNTKITDEFPWLKRPTGKGAPAWNAHELTVAGASTERLNRNPSVQALSIWTKNIKGKRGIVIADDLEGPEERESPAQAEKLYKRVTWASVRMIEDVTVNPRRAFINAGTPFFPDSLHLRLADHHAFRTFRQPYRNPDGSLAWPSKREKIKELWALWTREQFLIAMELDPTGGRKDLLSVDQLIAMGHQSGTSMGSKEGGLFICLDPASGSRGRRPDYAGVTLNRLSWRLGEVLPRIETGLCWIVRTGAMDQLRLVNSVHERFGGRILIEGNSNQRGHYYWLISEFFPHLQPVVEYLYTDEDKKLSDEMGVEVMIDMFKSGYWKLVSAKERVGRIEEAKHALITEIRDWGTSQHDHLLMSAWLTLCWAFDHKPLYEPKRDPLELPPEPPSKAERYRRAYGFGRGYAGQRQLLSHRA